MIGYALPTPTNDLVIWTDAPRRVWGELNVSEITVLSPDPDLDVGNIPLMLHDNVYRPTVRKMWFEMPRLYMSRLMLWGLIWLLGIDQPLQDVVGGFYLFFGIPLFSGLIGAARNKHKEVVTDRLAALFRYPKVRIEYSPRLEKIRYIMNEEGPTAVLDALNGLGFAHLREFYRRATWNERWVTMPPTGAGIINAETE